MSLETEHNDAMKMLSSLKKGMSKMQERKANALRNDGIDGNYLLRRNLNHRKAGDVLKSQGGTVKGLLDPETMKIISFLNKTYFSSYN